MWVRLKSIQYVSEHGQQLTKYPGGWVNVGRQKALSWIAEGSADRPDQPNLDALPGCGVVTGGDAVIKGLEVFKSGVPVLEFSKTLLWSGVGFRRDLLATGFHLLDTWEIAVPLLSYDTLACDIGDEQERDETRRVVRDVRGPVSATRLRS